MHYVYILQSEKNGDICIGCTNDLKKRFIMHNSGKVVSTKNKQPLKLIHYKSFIDKHDAFTREQWLKTGWGRNRIRKMLSNYFKNLGR
ncbi:MAG: GIY-YIG nuclease family protein [Parcubacteria group bacterium]|nr:GIY-YIG nuclease family protein [Parcubacteria group bacterium]